MRNTRGGLYALVVVQILACSEYQPSQLHQTSLDARTVFQRKAQVALREAADALSDSNHRGLQGAGGAAFALQDVVNQTCVNQPDGAVITIQSSHTTSFAMDTPEKNYQKDVFVNAEVVRSYTLPDEDLECARKQTMIEVDLDRDLVNLQFDVKHRREEKSYISELQKPKVDEKKEAEAEGAPSEADPAPEVAKEGETPAATPPPPSRQMTSIASLVEGTRKVTFTAALGEVEDDVSYSKESQGTGTRRESVQSTGGPDQLLNFTIQSQFKMVDTYDEQARDRAVGQGPIRKEITSGSVKSTLAGQGFVETIFTNVKLEFNQGACKAISGQIQSRFFAEGGAAPQKTVDYDVASGSVKVSVTVDSQDFDPLKDRADILASMDLQKELCAQDAFLD
ncbi:MAG TPA: hypothetical protein VE954_04450 [Oligoflexus sp.]|uniref:hypothetical protein n=1 Tax=Oligoflexus sp. TaxID=1971216 RepID=UPI002D29BC44|nr:hypothetical protein [Oligoflexus sp.]HYX32340.1 hypothetical protein [Oligoflexus sp.]